MTEKGNNNNNSDLSDRASNELPEGRKKDLQGDDATTPNADRSGICRQKWEQLPSDPDLREDFGYAFGEWEEFATLDESEMLMFLPSDEEVLHKDAFVVVAEDSMVDLGQKY